MKNITLQIPLESLVTPEDFRAALENSLLQAINRSLPQITKNLQIPLDEILLTKKDVAQLFRVSQKTISEWMKDGKITYSRIGGRVYFKKSLIVNQMPDIRNKKTQG